jgi:hypothetical protein
VRRKYLQTIGGFHEKNVVEDDEQWTRFRPISKGHKENYAVMAGSPMSKQVQQSLKVTDQGAEKIVQKTPEAVKDGGVIAAAPNQEVHGQAFASAHQNDKTLSEPDMIAMNDGETVAEYKARVAQVQANRFGFFDLAEEKTNDAGAGVAGRAKIHEYPAKQAVEPLPTLSPTMQKAPFDSSVKVNAQITNVPEVSEVVQQEVLGKYAETVLENAAAVVRQVENHLAQPGALNSDFQKIGQWVSEGPGHFAQSPEQLNKDISAVATGAMEEIDKPLSVDERAKKAGMLLPMFFFEGGSEPINPETIDQMGLEGMNEAELKALGIEKRIEQLSAAEETEMLKSVDKTVEAMDESAEVIQRSITHEKVVNYLFNPTSPDGWSKGQWFIKALGFDPQNVAHVKMLEEQIKFDSSRAVVRPATEYGERFNLSISVTGPNGKTIDGIRTAWQRDKESDIIRLVTIYPPKQR